MTREEQFYSIAESFGVLDTYKKNIEIIRQLKYTYGPDMTLKEMEEQLWAEKMRIEEGIKNQLTT